MRHLVLAAVTAVGVSLAANAAIAAPLVVPPLSSGIVEVSGGCGPAGFRAANGACYRRRLPPPRAYRGCPPGAHPTPYGCRRNF